MELNILSFHGLYSQGNNLEILINALEFEAEENSLDVVTSQHDYPVLKIWQGGKTWAREIVAEYILKCLALEYRKFPDAECWSLCHSNGTFGMANALNKYFYQKQGLYDTIKLDKLILFGSVIKDDFDWNRFPQIKVINFIGRKDRVAGMAPLYGMGASGKHGFNIPAKNLTQIETNWTHSDFVNPENFELIRDNLFGK